MVGLEPTKSLPSERSAFANLTTSANLKFGANEETRTPKPFRAAGSRPATSANSVTLALLPQICPDINALEFSEWNKLFAVLRNKCHAFDPHRSHHQCKAGEAFRFRDLFRLRRFVRTHRCILGHFNFYLQRAPMPVSYFQYNGPARLKLLPKICDLRPIHRAVIAPPRDRVRLDQSLCVRPRVHDASRDENAIHLERGDFNLNETPLLYGHPFRIP